MKYILISYKESSMAVLLSVWLIQRFDRPAPIGFRCARVVFYDDASLSVLKLKLPISDVLVAPVSSNDSSTWRGVLKRLLVPFLVRDILEDEKLNLSTHVLRYDTWRLRFRPTECPLAPEEDFSKELDFTQQSAPVLLKKLEGLLRVAFGNEDELKAIARTETSPVRRQSSRRRKKK